MIRTQILSITIAFMSALAGCSSSSPKQHLRELSLETVSEFHLKLAELCDRYYLEARYIGPLAMSGRGLVITSGDMDQIDQWAVTPNRFPDGDQQVIFSIQATAGLADANSIATVRIRQHAIQLIVPLRGGLKSVDSPVAELRGKSVREFLSEAE